MSSALAVLRFGRLCLFGLLLWLAAHASALAQVVNGDFSSGSTGWTSTIPSGSSLTYTGGHLTAVSDNNGGTNSRTFASQSVTVPEYGYLSLLLVSYTSADTGQYDYPMVRIGATYYWVTTAGVLTTTASAGIDNDNSGITNVTARRSLTAATYTIGAGVTSTDSCCGSGTAVWDDVQFQQLTQTPGAQTTAEDTNLVFSTANSNAISVATNSGLSSMTVTISVTNGTLTLASTAGITITAGANGSATMTFNGSPTSINTALNGVTYAPTANFFGSSTLTFTVNDGSSSDTDTVAITVTSVPDYLFTISKTRSLANVSSLPATINYTITVTNTGDTAMTGTSISDLLTQGAGSQSLSLSGPSGDGAPVGTFGVGEVWVYTASYSVTQANMDNGANLVNTVAFSTAQASAQNASATTTITQSPGLSIVKTADKTVNVSVGDVITYTYVVANSGNITIDNVSVAEAHGGFGPAPVPAGETLSSDIAPLSDSTDATGNNGVWSTLAPGDSVTFTGTYTVTQADIDAL